MRITGAKRVTILALSSLTCALLSLLVALGRESLGNPVVVMVAIPLTLWPALWGFFYSLTVLWNVNLAKAIPLVIVATVAAVAATARIFFFVSPFVGLGVALLVMQWCQSCSPWVLHEPPQPSVFREGLKFLATRKP